MDNRNFITLNCHIIGHTPVTENIFHVRPDRNQTIADCKSFIQESQNFERPASLLKLWCLSKPIAIGGTDANLSLTIMILFRVSILEKS